MCLGSISPPTCDLCQLDDKKPHPTDVVNEEDRCGEVGHDGVRRFSQRRVLCKGSEVFIGMWHGTVESLNMEEETVRVKYTTGGLEEDVPLTSIRSVVINQFNRDLQVSMSSMFSKFTSVAYDIKTCITTCSPSYYYYTVAGY
eukprot:TRINITY_DN12037_c0_g2_i2.p1 TRINITY_DN12037_c0_g2~~TRINITY_DN12037_c0_g2_i2.p1  ORF type:complete len:167 (+),score=27.13 TRINITY_DN12037_c0_g2_i2:75-503(+)